MWFESLRLEQFLNLQLSGRALHYKPVKDANIVNFMLLMK